MVSKSSDIKCVLVTGKFQNPMHIAHLNLLFKGLERAKELGVPVMIITGPGDDKVKEVFGEQGLTFKQRQILLHILTGVSKEMIFGHESYSHGGKVQFEKYEQELKGIFKKAGYKPSEVELCVIMKDEDKKHYLDESADHPKKHYAELLNERIGLKIHNFDVEKIMGLSSTAIRGDREIAEKFMSSATFLLKTFKEHGVRLGKSVWQYLHDIHEQLGFQPAENMPQTVKSNYDILTRFLYPNKGENFKLETGDYVDLKGVRGLDFQGFPDMSMPGKEFLFNLMSVRSRDDIFYTRKPITHPSIKNEGGPRVYFVEEVSRIPLSDINSYKDK